MVKCKKIIIIIKKNTLKFRLYLELGLWLAKIIRKQEERKKKLSRKKTRIFLMFGSQGKCCRKKKLTFFPFFLEKR